MNDHVPFLHGFLKIERQDAAGTWNDVTMELLNLGFAGPNQDGQICADPTPNAVIRLQRLRDNGLTTACGLAANNYSASRGSSTTSGRTTSSTPAKATPGCWPPTPA